METIKEYKVEITAQAKLHYFEILEYFYEYMSYGRATKKANELYDCANSLKTLPERGQLELTLQHLKKEYRYLLYHSASRRTIKIIYLVDHKKSVVYITDFFPTPRRPQPPYRTIFSQIAVPRGTGVGQFAASLTRCKYGIYDIVS